MASNADIEIAAELVRQTDDAWLIDDGDKQIWLPKSLVTANDDEDEFTMPEWLAKKHGLI